MVGDYVNIGFDLFHSPDISIPSENRKARRNKEMKGRGICFLNQPMKFGRDVFIRILETFETNGLPMDFGLTNKTLKTIENEYECSRHEGISFFSGYNDVLCLCLNKNSTLSYSINNGDKKSLQLKNVSLSLPVWLFFKLYDVKEIEISSEKIVGEINTSNTRFIEI